MSQHPAPLHRYGLVREPRPWWHRWTGLAAVAGVLLWLVLTQGGCAGRQTPPPCSAPPCEAPAPSAGPTWMDLLWDAALDAIPDMIRWALDEWEQSRQRPAGLMSARAAAADEVLGVRLTRERNWNRPAIEGQRIRMAPGPGGSLTIAWTRHLGGRNWRATLETADGQLLDERQFVTSRGGARFHPAYPVGGLLLYLDGDSLRHGGELMATGGFEAYHALALPGLGAAAVAFDPCPEAERPCAGTVLWRPASGSRQWSRREIPAWEVFGVQLALAPGATSTVAVASREQPVSGGWSLRRVPAAPLVLSGELPRDPVQRWQARGLSLGDPAVVQGASPPAMLRQATERPAGGSGVWPPTGRVFYAEAGDGRLREIGRVGATVANLEMSAAVWGRLLWVAAELDGGGRSGLWRYDSHAGALVLMAEVPGGWPWVAVAEGQLYIASTAGLWRVAHPP